MEHLLLLHGALGHPRLFADLKKHLEERFIVHTLLFSGHGDSQLPEHGIMMQDYVDQVADHCAGLGVEKISIFGYSMGGYVALCYAAAFPHKVSAVMTLAAKLNWDPAIAEKEAKMLQPAVVSEKVPGFAAYLSGLHGEQSWRPLMSAVATLLKDLGENPSLTPEIIKNINIKTQLMVGDKDNMVSISETQAAFQLLPDANFAVLPDTVHPFEKVNKTLLLQMMVDFFGK